MIEYLDLVEDVLTNGVVTQSQKTLRSIAVMGRQIKYDLSGGFPLITTRDLRVSLFKNVIPEMLWIIEGSTKAYDLHKHGSHLWDKWAVAAHDKLGYENGELGPIYGHQLRNFAGHVDQLTQVIDMLKRDPHTRRALISLWNLEDVEKPDGTHVVDVAPCITALHFLYICGKLDMAMTQRSADVPIGVPNDIAEWALFQMLVAKAVNLPPGTLTHNLDDAHIYLDQVDAMKVLLKRQPLPRPEIRIQDSLSGTIYDHQVADFELVNYYSHPAIKIPVAL